MSTANVITINQPVFDTSKPVKIVDRAKGFEISDAESHAEAQIILQDAAALKKEIQSRFEEPVRLAHQAHKSMVALRSSLIDPIDGVIRALGRATVDYEQAEQKRAEEAARIESERIAEEERKRREEEIENAVDDEEADEIRHAHEVESAQKVVVAAAPETSTVKGVHNVTRWSAEVTDLQALIQFVAKNPSWTSLLIPNMAQLNALAKAQKAEMKQFPGVKSVSVTTKSIRA